MLFTNSPRKPQKGKKTVVQSVVRYTAAAAQCTEGAASTGRTGLHFNAIRNQGDGIRATLPPTTTCGGSNWTAGPSPPPPHGHRVTESNPETNGFVTVEEYRFASSSNLRRLPELVKRYSSTVTHRLSGGPTQSKAAVEGASLAG